MGSAEDRISRGDTMSDLLSNLAQWAIETVYSFGYLGLFVVVALANVHLPIPTEITLPLAGFLVGQGRFSLIPVLAASEAGAVVGAIAHYLPGYWFGEERLRRLVKRYGRFVFMRESDLDWASEMFERHGGKAIVLAHLIPGLGSLISVPAGIKRWPIYGRFMVYTLLGSALWNGIFIALGWVLGTQWPLVKQYARIVEYVVLAAIAAGILWFVWHRWRARR
jgi:membrane protein DedA with SNARE-associated domain